MTDTTPTTTTPDSAIAVPPGSVGGSLALAMARVGVPVIRMKLFGDIIERVRVATDKKTEAAAALVDFVAALRASTKMDATISTRTTQLRTLLTAALGMDASDLPSLPRVYSTRKRKRASDCIVKGQVHPLCIGNYSALMDHTRAAIRFGIDKKQAPMVSFYLGFWLPLRANDHNENRLRANGSKCDANTHRLVEGIKTDDGLDVVGTIVNFNPSKAGRATTVYATVFICDVEDYPLACEALAFLHDPKITSLPCTTTVKEYKAKVPSGPEVNRDWRTHESGIFEAMLDETELDAFVSDWGENKTGAIIRGMGRWFGASSIEQGRFRLPAPLTPSVALGASLGHVPNSSSNPAYLCVHCGDDVPKVRGVSMRNAARSPLCLDGGIKITSGVYLVADPPPPP
jgi:hypothetical protein